MAIAFEGYDTADVLMVDEKDLTSEWILDLGCTFHMCPIKSWFSSYMERNEGKVRMGNNEACKVFGMGLIKLRLHDGMERTLTNVRYVLDLKRNLISLGMLDLMGCTIKIENGTLNILKGAMIMMKGLRKNGLYNLQGEIVVGTSIVVAKDGNETAKLLHMRLGHVSEKGLQILSQQGLLGKEKQPSLSFCEQCILRKKTKVKFNLSPHTTK